MSSFPPQSSTYILLSRPQDHRVPFALPHDFGLLQSVAAPSRSAWQLPGLGPSSLLTSTRTPRWPPAVRMQPRPMHRFDVGASVRSHPPWHCPTHALLDRGLPLASDLLPPRSS